MSKALFDSGKVRLKGGKMLLGACADSNCKCFDTTCDHLKKATLCWRPTDGSCNPTTDWPDFLWVCAEIADGTVFKVADGGSFNGACYKVTSEMEATPDPLPSNFFDASTSDTFTTCTECAGNPANPCNCLCFSTSTLSGVTYLCCGGLPGAAKSGSYHYTNTQTTTIVVLEPCSSCIASYPVTATPGTRQVIIDRHLGAVTDRSSCNVTYQLLESRTSIPTDGGDYVDTVIGSKTIGTGGAPSISHSGTSGTASCSSPPFDPSYVLPTYTNVDNSFGCASSSSTTSHSYNDERHTDYFCCTCDASAPFSPFAYADATQEIVETYSFVVGGGCEACREFRGYS